VPAATSLADELLALGHEAGLDVAGIAAVEPFEGTRRDLEQRKAAGLHGGMRFTYKDPARSSDPTGVLPGARSLLVGARSYRRDDPVPPDGEGPLGHVARYARQDHTGALREALQVVARRLKEQGWRSRVLVDDNALVDREAARRAGLGWYGKNANLLVPGKGSWFVLGAVATDAPLPPASAPVADGCGPCRRCLDGCPTDAIVAPGVVDARRCLAWLLQDEGSFPEEHRVALGGRIYGCDDCQEVCPPNRVALRRADEADRPEATWVPLLRLLEGSDEEVLQRNGRWYLHDRDPRYLRRNALVAVGNVGDPDDPEVRRAVARHAAGDDALLAEHARWALARLDERAVGPAA
jgi:epoxyqueuosine reductase